MRYNDIITPDFISQVKKFEGFVGEKAYKCPAGVWTVGYGHTRGVDKNTTMAEDVASDVLAMELISTLTDLVCENANYLLLPISVLQSLTDWLYNIGLSSFRKSTLKKVLDKIDNPVFPTESELNMISIQILRWDHCNGKVLPGLSKRREWEVNNLFKFLNK